jgi:probable HAF family extracellular repeat protein
MQRTTRIILAVALAGGIGAAQASRPADAPPDYHVTHLSPLGGSNSIGNSINDVGLIAGASTLDGADGVHAAAWLYGLKFDLGTLGGASSSVVWPVKSNTGLVSGISQTAIPDPLGESWSCGAFIGSTGTTCQGFAWEFGHMRALPPLPGGNNSFATGANDLHQIVGWAENGVHDPSCDPESDQVLQFRPVVWGPGRNQVRELPLLRGDSSGAATAINDRGQVVGISGTCDQAVGRFTAAHMVLWDHGRAIQRHDLGGEAWNTPRAINGRGDGVGFANVPGGATPATLHEHAFLRTRDGITTDLGTLPGDARSQAYAVNEHGQVVGMSCTADYSNCRGFLWQRGVMTDLNTLVVSGDAGQILYAQDINDFGQITGQAVDAATGGLAAFRAIPVPHRGGHRHGDRRAPTGRRMPDGVRKALLQRLGLGRAALSTDGSR